MMPIVLGIIGASGADTRTKGFTLSLMYVAGIAVVYTALGVFAALTGSLFGSIATSPYSLLLFGNLCFVLALWMMDWIRIPVFSSGKISTKSGHIGVFITGVLSGFVAAPCTSPVMAGLLIYVSETKNLALGGALLFAFSIGMTTTVIVLGTFSGALKTLPKPGPWMEWVKKGLALFLFALGERYIMRAGGLL